MALVLTWLGFGAVALAGCGSSRHHQSSTSDRRTISTANTTMPAAALRGIDTFTFVQDADF
jgi:hypothetical protein